MNKIKCECGHVNPVGTILCEACGRGLNEDENSKTLIDMRYEGTARRSQTYNKTIIDKIWNFFSSVKNAVIIIIITLIASAVGTIFPQEMNLQTSTPPEIYYEEEYGWPGKIYYLLGFHDLYGSLWYILLVASIGVSLVICSLDRFIPLYRALKNQRVKRHYSFIKRQRFFNEINSEIADDEWEIVKKRLVKKRYKVKEENGSLLAEKGRFSRWGPYVNHIGLIIFLIGLLLRFVPGMYVNDQMLLKEGDIRAIPGTDKEYYLENHEFIIEYYTEEDGEIYKKAIEDKGAIVKNFQSNVTLYKAVEESLPGEIPELEKIKDFEIKVNKPLKHDHYALYQASYRLNELSSMTFTLINKETEEEYGTITINLENPEKSYDLGNGYKVQILNYFPDFVFQDGEPITQSPDPLNPAFAFNIIAPDKPEGEQALAAIQQTIEPLGENTYKMKFEAAEFVNYTGLIIRKDLTLWLISIGGAIFLIGVAQGSFWQHRRIWISQGAGKITIAAHTNKSWYSFMKEIEKIIEDTKLPLPLDQGSDRAGRSQQGVKTDG